jgi:site-specific recombinase XerD
MAKTPKPAWVPPRGISYYTRKDSEKKPFWLSWYIDGKRKAEGYETEADREIAARSLADRLAEHGASVILSFEPNKWKRWLEFERIVGEDVDPVVVATEWKQARQGKAASLVGLWLQEAVERYFALRKNEKTWGRDAERHADTQVRKRFVAAFPGRRVNEITTEDVRAWLLGLKGKDGEPMHPLTVKDHRKNLSTFFDYAVREGWVMMNPVELVKPPRVAQEDVHVIPIRQAFEFFKANRDARCIGRIAMEAFGGIRYSTAGRLNKEGLNFEQKGIRMLGRMHKSGRTKYRQGHPENLWEWLKHAPEKCWEMTELQYREEKRAAAIHSGLRPALIDTEEDRRAVAEISNIWRHSFASYHLACFKTPTLTQYLMQHSSIKMTEVYEGVADESDAKLFFSITPASVALTWEQFVRKPFV